MCLCPRQITIHAHGRIPSDTDKLFNELLFSFLCITNSVLQSCFYWNLSNRFVVSKFKDHMGMDRVGLQCVNRGELKNMTRQVVLTYRRIGYGVSKGPSDNSF